MKVPMIKMWFIPSFFSIAISLKLNMDHRFLNIFDVILIFEEKQKNKIDNDSNRHFKWILLAIIMLYIQRINYDIKFWIGRVHAHQHLN